MSIAISEYVMRDDQICFKKLPITVKKLQKQGFTRKNLENWPQKIEVCQKINNPL